MKKLEEEWKRIMPSMWMEFTFATNHLCRKS